MPHMFRDKAGTRRDKQRQADTSRDKGRTSRDNEENSRGKQGPASRTREGQAGTIVANIIHEPWLFLNNLLLL